MDPSNAQNQAMSTQSMEEMLACPKQQQEKRMKPQPEQALKCPRCDSANTKFCYYNNYSQSQPRYFCKGCRRYWTQGGTLRNIPVGGGCRKNKRSSSSKKPAQDQSPTTNSPSTSLPILSSLTYDSNDLTLAFARLHKQATGQLGLDDHPTSILGNLNTTHCDLLGNHDTITTTPTTTASFLDVRSGFLDVPGILPNSYYGIGNGNIGDAGGLGGGEEMVLPFGEMDSGLTTTASKQGSCKGGELENRALWGMQWQLGADGNMTTDSARDYWNGVGSTWQGLVNGSLV